MRLFDGKSLEGWRKLDTRGTWTAEDGQIVGKGSYTGIVRTTVLKAPYTLSLEVMKQSTRGFASGLLFGAKPDVTTHRGTASCYWVRLHDARGYALRLECGPDTLWQSTDARFAPNKWHGLLLTVGTKAVALRCDGQQVFQVRVKRPTDGAVGFLAHDTTRFRNILCAKGIQKSAPKD